MVSSNAMFTCTTWIYCETSLFLRIFRHEVSKGEGNKWCSLPLHRKKQVRERYKQGQISWVCPCSWKCIWHRYWRSWICYWWGKGKTTTIFNTNFWKVSYFIFPLLFRSRGVFSTLMSKELDPWGLLLFKQYSSLYALCPSIIRGTREAPSATVYLWFMKYKSLDNLMWWVISFLIYSLLNWSYRGTETLKHIQKRLRNARAELHQSNEPDLFDHLSVNDDLETCYENLKVIHPEHWLPCMDFCFRCKTPIMTLIFSK